MLLPGSRRQSPTRFSRCLKLVIDLERIISKKNTENFSKTGLIRTTDLQTEESRSLKWFFLILFLLLLGCQSTAGYTQTDRYADDYKIDGQSYAPSYHRCAYEVHATTQIYRLTQGKLAETRIKRTDWGTTQAITDLTLGAKYDVVG